MFFMLLILFIIQRVKLSLLSLSVRNPSIIDSVSVILKSFGNLDRDTKQRSGRLVHQYSLETRYPAEGLCIISTGKEIPENIIKTRIIIVTKESRRRISLEVIRVWDSDHETLFHHFHCLKEWLTIIAQFCSLSSSPFHSRFLPFLSFLSFLSFFLLMQFYPLSLF